MPQPQGKPGKASVVPKHTKDRTRKVWRETDTDTYVLLDDQGGFLTTNGFGDSGDARMLTLGQAVGHAQRLGVGNVLNVAHHPQLAVLFYTNK